MATRTEAGSKGRRASLVIQETADKLAEMRCDANRSEALMAELEALLAASRAPEAGGGRSSVYTSPNFTSAQTLEIPADEDLDEDDSTGEYYRNGDEDEDETVAVEDELLPRRLQTLLSVQRTASVVSLGCQNPSLFITGQSASFTARPGFAPQAGMFASAPAPQAGGSTVDGRRALSMSSNRLGGGGVGGLMGGHSFTIGRSGPSQTGLRSVNSSGPNSGAIPRRSTGTGSGAAPLGSPERVSNSSAATAAAKAGGGAAGKSERRPSIVAWALHKTRSQSRRFSGTSESPLSPVASTAAAATAGEAAAAPPSPLVAGLTAVSSHRRASVCEVPHVAVRASSTSHVSFLPRLTRRDSDTLNGGQPCVMAGGGNSSGSNGGGFVAPDSPVAYPSGAGGPAGSRRFSFTSGGRWTRNGKE